MHRRRPDRLLARRPRALRGLHSSYEGEEGFTLLELIIVVLVLPIVVGAITAGLVAIFSIQGSVSHRLSDSADAQIVSANYVQDVQSSQEITTDQSIPSEQCGPGTQLLGLEWNPSPLNPLVYETVVTYSKVRVGTTNVYLLRRQLCTSGFSTTSTAATTISFDLPASQGSPILTPSSYITSASQGWIPVANISNVQFSTTEPASNYTLALSATPASAAPQAVLGQPIVSTANTQCGFAPTQGGTVQNGTYAQTLCLVDFSSFNPNQVGCQQIVASIPGTGDSLSFCLSTSGNQPLEAAKLPTWPEAFLGNTIGGAPFYTGIGCPDSTPPTDGLGNPTPSCSSPALYQTDTGFGPTNTITVTNIAVTTATGAPATGWDFVSADAESTDVGEEIIWTSDKALSLVPNTPSSPYGNTCDNQPTYTNTGPLQNGPDQIICASGNNETGNIKTGTVMVDALQPSTMTVYMKGAGLEGVAMGLLIS